VAAIVMADQSGQGAQPASQQNEEGALAAALTLFVGVILDDEIGVRAQRHHAQSVKRICR